MKRPILAYPTPLLAALAVFAILAGGCQRSPWTTDSPEALAEFEKCLDTDMKFYWTEAARHCERALELDPGFLAAKLRIVSYSREMGNPERAKELLDEIRQADLSRLTDRERFLVSFQLARTGEHPEEAQALLDAYLAEHPKDPWAINIECMGPWLRQDWDEAEACYHELLQADPNWVIAQNHLGYIAMARGQFLDAEEQFETYRFIAPDQANPHDSLGELLTLIGRYEDARNELEKALEVRPDFCASYDHLIRIDLLEQQFDQAEAVLARRERQKDCPEKGTQLLVCSIAMWRTFARGDWEGTWQAAKEHDCLEPNRNEAMILAHSSAVRTGRFEEAHQMEEHLAQRLEKAEQYGRVDRDAEAAVLAHMKGTRLEAEGDPAAAAERYATADRLLRYWTADGLAFFKLFNQLSLAGALAKSGDPEGEEAVLRRVRSVNPRMEAVFYQDRGSTANPAQRAGGTQ